MITLQLVHAKVWLYASDKEQSCIKNPMSTNAYTLQFDYLLKRRNSAKNWAAPPFQE